MPWARRTLVMGVLNLTPDSFSDGGRLHGEDRVLRRAEQMVRQGADVLDLGAQSTRPGAGEVGVEEELRRLLPALRALRRAFPRRAGDGDAGPAAPLLSVDTFHAAVAEAALAAGADWINDVRGANVTAAAPAGSLRDPAMAGLVAAAGCPYVLMHSRGDSRSMDGLARYGDVVGEVREELLRATDHVLAAGVRADRLIWDPGLGFAKTTEQNLTLLGHLEDLGREGLPLLVGPSRKRFIGEVLAEPRPRARLWGTAAVCALAVQGGAAVLRVHDVGPIVQTARMAEAVAQSFGGR